MSMASLYCEIYVSPLYLEGISTREYSLVYTLRGDHYMAETDCCCALLPRRGLYVWEGDIAKGHDG
jgi:hypothetical protein